MAVPVPPVPQAVGQTVAVPDERARLEVEGPFAECILQGLYQHLLDTGIIESLEDLLTINYIERRDYGTSYVPEICENVDIILTSAEDPRIYNENVFVLPISEDLIFASLQFSDYASSFYTHFEDEFDFLIFVTSLYQFESQWLSNQRKRKGGAYYINVSNDVHGIGRPIKAVHNRWGSEGRLQGMIAMSDYTGMNQEWLVSHELMHRWGNHIIPPGSHWDFMSAFGLLGGFDIADLVDLGGGRYAVRAPWRAGGTFGFHEVYSPIELYLAGFIPAEEVPDIWVAEGVKMLRDPEGRIALTEGRYQIWVPSNVSTYTIEDIIAEHGKRVPDWSHSQREFRAAVILLIDEHHPATKWQLDELSSYVATFSHAGPDDIEGNNFFETTGGRATITMDGLSAFLKEGSDLGGQPTGEQPESSGATGETTQATPTPAPSLAPDQTSAETDREAAFSLVSAGGRHTCGLTGDHSAACWGNNEDGRATPPDAEFSSISAGGSYTCGIERDGSLACWGRDEHGQSMPPSGEFTAVSSGAWHACAIKRDGSVTCWGLNEYGQVTPPDGEFTSVSAGATHTCGITKDGSVACWGFDRYGQATPPDGEFTSVSAAGTHACGVKRDGSVTCWGSNTRGQATPPVGEFISVSSGTFHNCGVREDGSVACWGLNEWGSATPPEGEFASVSAGSSHTCGIKRDGSVACSDRAGTCMAKPLPPGSCAPSPSACCIAATSGLSLSMVRSFFPVDRNQRTTVRMTRTLATLPMLSTPHGDQSNNELNLPRLREPIIMREDSSNPEPIRPVITKTSKATMRLRSASSAP